MDLELLQRTLDELGEPAYRTRQVWRWTAQGARDFQAMTNLPLGLRAALAERVPFSSLAQERRDQSADGTVKALLRTHDSRPVEAVLMHHPGPRDSGGHDGRRRPRDAERGAPLTGRRTLCLSSQSGCPLTCRFCATGQMRFGRNLTASEILDQALHFRRADAAGAAPPMLHNAVFMGMGEPMMNLDAVLEACDCLPDLGIGHRRTAISTVGWIPGIERLAAHPAPIRLALSLHAADEALRSELMPVNDRYPLADVLAACRAYYERKRRMVFVEYVMLAGVNDSHLQARQLAAALDARMFKVNLIPFNPTDSPYAGSTAKATEAFVAELARHGIGATVRVTRGRDIAAACGQLASGVGGADDAAGEPGRDAAGEPGRVAAGGR